MLAHMSFLILMRTVKCDTQTEPELGYKLMVVLGKNEFQYSSVFEASRSTSLSSLTHFELFLG